MVRLRATNRSDVIAPATFQFQYGEIERLGYLKNVVDSEYFQFQYGEIERMITEIF